MLDSEFSIRDDFEATDYRQWLEMVESSLKGKSFEEALVTHSLEGVKIRPLYVGEDFQNQSRNSNAPSSTKSNAAVWLLRQEYCEPEPAALHRIIQDDLAGGVDAVELVLDRAGRFGFDPDDKQAEGLVGEAGAMVYQTEDLSSALEGVEFRSVSVVLRSGASFLPAAAMLFAACREQGVSPSELRLFLGGDPLGALASEGRIPMSLETACEQLATLAGWVSENSPHSTSVCVDAMPYHEAGASAVQELAFAMTTGVKYLRVLTDAGMTVEAAASQFEFRFGLGTQHFTEIAKLRAARLLWARVVAAFSGDPARTPMKLHARLGNRSLTQLDPELNILRNTVAVFAAGIGGADSIASIPFDRSLGDGSDFSRRVARNTANVLKSEAHLHRVADPGRGSWFLESLTEDLAQQAWELFQQLEAEGGIVEGVLSGSIAELIDAVHQQRVQAYASGEQVIVGVNLFRNEDGKAASASSTDSDAAIREVVKRFQDRSKQSKSVEPFAAGTSAVDSAIDAAAGGASLGQLATALGFHNEEVMATKLPLRRFAEPFETDSLEKVESP